jgi:hypothetical protein
MPRKNPAAVALGRRGGKKLAKERGPEYFAQLNAMRKTRASGRPAKKKLLSGQMNWIVAGIDMVSEFAESV